MNKQDVQLAAKIYECHETAKRLWKDQFDEKVAIYIRLLHGAMNKHTDGDCLKAVLWLQKDSPEIFDGMALMMLLAASVEIIEGGK